ncbi:MAG: hypothetical protein IPM29_00100 [Planctomycetes bacterium]|nr:hypothetical protein [Planctomycetota bacterium]
MGSHGFRRLDAARIIETIEKLRDRIRDRFPAANLGRVAEELLDIARSAAARSEQIRRPNLLLRLVSFVLLVLGGAALVVGVGAVHPKVEDEWRLAEVIQTLEALLGALFFVSAGVVLIASLEARSKRHRCIRAIHELRAMAHIVDMHQLTKDPERLSRTPEQDTPHSPPRPTMTRFELTRYLDYCSEILSLIGKVAALYVQDFPDEQARDAVDDVEDLTTGLSRKIWQKIMILGPRDGDGE